MGAVLYLDSVSIGILDAMSFYTFVRCYHGGREVKGT